MSRRNRKRRSDSHPHQFSRLDLEELALPQDRWLNYERPLEFLSVDTIRRAMGESLRGAWAQIQWMWEQLEPADAILSTCVERRLGALKRIPWDIVKKEDLSDAEDTLAEAQLRTLRDLANAIENIDEGIAALAQASFRHYRHLQMLETDYGTLRLNITENWNWCRDGYRGPWRWNPAATYGLTKGEPLPVPQESIISRICPRPIDQPAMMLALDRKNARAQWLVFNGRYGVPPLFAIMPSGIDAATRAKYMDFARRCISNAAGVLPAGSDVKAVNPGSTGPDTFSKLIELSTQEMVLRATGGLMTMLTAPGAGTNTETGSAHQDAFDDLAAAEAEEIASVLQERLFAPALEQWHPGQPHLVEFTMRRPDSDNATGTIANVASLAGAGYRTDAAQVADLTGLAVQDTGAPSPEPREDYPALRSLHTRYAPTMLYPPARETFERAINSRLNTPPDEGGSEEQPLTQEELAALQSLGKGFAEGELAEAAGSIYDALEEAVAENSCNQYGHEDGCSGATQKAQKGGRATKGNPRAKTTRSNTPLKAAPGAKPQAKVDAIEHALRATQKGGKVEGVAKIGKKSLDIEAGHPDYHGTRHAARHFNPEETDPREVAKTLIYGEKKQIPAGTGKIATKRKGSLAILADKKENLRLITSYKPEAQKKSPGREPEPTDG